MAGYRSRSYSPRRRYSRSPPRRNRYDDPRDRYRGGGGGGGGARRGYGRPSAQTGLLIRNISLTSRLVIIVPCSWGCRSYDPGFVDSPLSGLVDMLNPYLPICCRPEDIRVPFEQFGPVKDVYLPRNFHTRELRSFEFVKFRYPEDAAVAKQEMNHQVIGGREISIVYAEENRKTPQEMRFRTRTR
nr:unnamed protein product [Digitaria exilis]